MKYNVCYTFRGSCTHLPAFMNISKYKVVFAAKIFEIYYSTAFVHFMYSAFAMMCSLGLKI